MVIEDLYPGVEKWEIPDKYYANLVDLLPRINAIEEACGVKLKCTSGFRTWAMHKAIYDQINMRREERHQLESPIPLHSRHLSGNAADLFDPQKKLQKLLLDEKLLTDNDLWSEGFVWTPDWVHIQNVAYGSWQPGGSRFFRPF